MDNEMLEKFFASNPAMIERDRNHIRKCIKILRDKQISMPVVSNYETVKDKVLVPEIMKLPRIHKEKTAEGYITSFNKYNDWLIEQQCQKGEYTMPLEYEEHAENNSGMATEETASEVSTVSDSENIEAISDTIDTKESENVSDINDIQAVDKSENTESMKATENIKDSENVSDIPDTKKASKKGNREQISLYIDRDIYMSLKRISKIEDTTITEIIGKLLAVFVKKNIEVLCENEQILSQIKRFEY